MEYCPQIQIFPSSVTLFTESDGRLLLDIDEQTSIGLQQVLRIEDDVYTIGAVPDISLSLPKTAKNYFYLKSLFNPNTEKPLDDFITVRMTVGSNTLKNDKLYGVSNSERIEIELKYEAEWIRKLKNTKLNQLDLGIFDLTRPHIEDKWENASMYNDGDDGHWFPVVNYGGWRQKGKLIVEDMRPFLHALFVIQKMFDFIGWCIEFPFYETELGRRNVDYLLKTTYGDSPSLRYRRTFDAKKDTSANSIFHLGAIVKAWTEVSDPGNSFNPATGIYKNVFEGKFTLTIKLGGIGNIFESNVSLRFSLVKIVNNAPLTPLIEATVLGQWTLSFYTSPQNNVYEVEANVNPGDEVYLYVESGDLEFIILPGYINIELTNTVERTFHARGDVIYLSHEVDQDLTCYDYLLGKIHLCSGIIDEYPSDKLVKILTPFNADIFGDTIQGYYNNTLVTLINNQPKGTATSKVRNEDQFRYIQIAFAKTTDELTKQIQEGQDEFFSKTIDLGDANLIDTEEKRNPLFEYTILHLTNNFVLASTGSYLIPLMSDNTEGRVSISIKARTLVAYGYEKVDNETHGIIVWENTLIHKLAFAAQNGSGILFGDPGTAIEMKLVYGDEPKDLWSLIIGKFFMQFRARIQIDLLATLNHREYFQFDLKKLFEIEYEGHPVTGRVIALNDWRPCDHISAQLLLMPEQTTGQFCESDDPTPCGNNPTIIATKVGNCWQFAIGGEFDCNVVSICWEVQFESDDVNTWTDLGCANTAEVCDAGEWFIIRAHIEYDCPDCPSSNIAEIIYPCSALLTCTLTQVFNDGQQWLTWNYQTNQEGTNCEFAATLQVFEDGVLTDTIILDTVGFIAPIINGALYILTVVLDCDNGCPDLTSICTFVGQTPPPPGTCDNVPILNCVPVSVNGVTCYEFAITGQMSSEYQTFIVTVFCDGVRYTWHEGDDPICCTGVISATAIVFFCDCPEVCTDEVMCNPSGCTIFNPGTAVLYEVCN